MLEEEEKAAAEATGKRKTKTKRGRGRGKKKTKTTNKFPNDPDAEGYEVSTKCVSVHCISRGYQQREKEDQTRAWARQNKDQDHQ